MLRTDDDFIKTRPCFIFREPIETFNSWKKLGWSSIDRFIESYIHVYQMMEHAKKINAPYTAITHEGLINDPEFIFKTITEQWEMPYSDKLISNYDYPFDNTHPRLHFTLNPENRKAEFAAVSSSENIKRSRSSTEQYISQEERLKICENLAHIYESIKNKRNHHINLLQNTKNITFTMG